MHNVAALAENGSFDVVIPNLIRMTPYLGMLFNCDEDKVKYDDQ